MEDGVLFTVYLVNSDGDWHAPSIHTDRCEAEACFERRVDAFIVANNDCEYNYKKAEIEECIAATGAKRCPLVKANGEFVARASTIDTAVSGKVKSMKTHYGSTRIDSETGDNVVSTLCGETRATRASTHQSRVDCNICRHHLRVLELAGLSHFAIVTHIDENRFAGLITGPNHTTPRMAFDSTPSDWDRAARYAHRLAKARIAERKNYHA